MNRNWKVKALTPLVRPARERKFLSMDTEDDQLGWGHGRGFYLGAVWTPAGGRSFTDRRKMIRFLLNRRWAGWWVACHNLEYDCLNLFGAAGLVLLNPCFSGSKLCAISVQVGEKESEKVTFCDTSCFLQDKLENLAPLVNLEKLEARHRRGDRRVTRRRMDYNLRDAEITFRLAHLIQDAVNALGAEMKLTAAATSLDCFRRKYLHEELPCLPGEILEAMHVGYCGGRVEAFRLGEIEGPVYQNDVNGAYVSVMIDTEFPVLGRFGPRSARKLDLCRQGMAEVDIEVPDHLWAAPLPVKGDKLVFPVGRLHGRWTYNELRQALNVGVKIRKVYKCWDSPESQPYMREMMISLRAVRENPATPAPVSRMAKLLGNSSYGKWGQKSEEFRYLTYSEYSSAVADNARIDGRPIRDLVARIYTATRIVKVVTGVKHPVHSNVIWAAIVTAGCRGLLYPHLEESSSFYCDTDSVIGTREYPETKSLGKLAIQHRYSKVVIRGCKLYAGKETESNRWVAHAKGYPKDMAKEAVLHPERPVIVLRPARLHTALAGRREANEWFESVRQHREDYDKREVLAGGLTRPLRMEMWT